MPPPGYEPFLRAICANPSDDAPRLVYADWLDENGDAQLAGFIRLQIAHAQAKQEDNVSRELLKRLRPLRTQAELSWRQKMPQLRGVGWQRYWRGFISGADFHAMRWFFRQSPMAFEITPLQFIRLTGLRPQHAEQFANCELLNRVTGLTLIGDPGLLWDVGWLRLSQSPYLKNLRSLHVIDQVEMGGNWQRYRRLRDHRIYTIIPRSAHYITTGTAFENVEEFVVQGYLDDPVVEQLRKRFGDGFTQRA